MLVGDRRGSSDAKLDDIVRQLTKRVEQIAWEVIPQMAETLIQDEIRRMKGEEGEESED